MGRHYRKRSGGIIKKAAALAVIIAALAGALAWFCYDSGKTLESARYQDVVVKEGTAVSPDAGEKEGAKKDTPLILSPDAAALSSDTAQRPGKPASPAAARPAEVKYSGPVPLLALIVDDGGGQMEYTKRVAALDMPLTWAIIPYQRYSKETAALAASRGVPYLLHLPMQAEVDKDGAQYIIGKGMSADSVRQKTAAALDSLPGAIGLNNHRGSLATADAVLMEPVMAELKRRGLIFVDSRTSGKSVAYATALSAGVEALQNRGFLDNTADKNAIAARFREIVKNAQKRGALVVICHFRPSTVMFLEELAKNYKNLPVKLVTAPEMLELIKEGAPEGES
ncbi:MAG: divergent polysaccharide deacetylase family protein [bacterium]|nr:divergent polysaccharide deacetylase family protein [bacterium]